MLFKGNYEPMPVIDCGDFYLRSICKKDARDLFEYGSDPQVTKFLSWGPYEDFDEARWCIDKYYLDRPNHKLPIGYAIIYKENQKMIGVIDYHTIDHMNDCGHEFVKKVGGRMLGENKDSLVTEITIDKGKLIFNGQVF